MTQGSGSPPYTRGFANANEQRRHFNHHGPSLGIISEQAYLDAADEFLGRQLRAGIQQCTRPAGRYAGDIVRWNPVTGEFGVLTANRVIRTYFRLDLHLYRRQYPTDAHYFRAQCQKT